MQGHMALLIAYRRRSSIDGEEGLCNDIAWKGRKESAPNGKREEAISEKKQNLHNLKITFGHFIRDG